MTQEGGELTLENPFKVYRGLNRNIYIIFIGQVINSMGAFVFPFLTMFLTQKIGMSPAEAGSYVTVAALANVPGMFLGAKLADSFGRKRLYLISSTLMALMLIPPAFLGTSKVVIYFLIMMSLFAGAVNPAFNAMVTDLTRGEERKKAFSLLYLGWNMGFAIGPMIAGFLFNHYLPLLFLGDAATAFIAIVLIGIYVPETKGMIEETPDEELPENERAEEGSIFRVLLKRPGIILVSFILLFFRLVYAQSSFALPIQMNEIFGQQGPAYYGINYSFNAIVVVAFTVLVTSVTVKLKPLANIIIAGLLLAVGFGMIYYIDILPLFFLSTFVWTIGEILEATNVNVYIASHAPVSHRARFNSIFMFISGAGYAFAPKLGGLFLEYYSIREIWLASFFVMVIASSALLLFYLGQERVKRLTCK
ncbi:MFS transporter [Halothermothrix orenii]|uniref:Major facilitator superfamily MFS_1 n=1 Tax=Halothermothrix orenii (strain H 168 / OCM 544 / DSM 9562) TaxID=373903 RepID=B8D277_HALOH|nr:MFS transporter [Halothermothrix orenii]ACL69304.1 major facilitator superfamily MFS_1 [Halothermothrix orenii H 168]